MSPDIQPVPVGNRRSNIRYDIEPTQQADFQTYARAWGQAIPRCGAELVGYFVPHEGSRTLAYGIYHVESLAAYERYRERLAADPIGRENYRFAQERNFIRWEDRTFLTLASAPHGERHDDGGAVLVGSANP